jgi:hypothetical protein
MPVIQSSIFTALYPAWPHRYFSRSFSQTGMVPSATSAFGSGQASEAYAAGLAGTLYSVIFVFLEIRCNLKCFVSPWELLLSEESDFFFSMCNLCSYFAKQVKQCSVHICKGQFLY